MRTYGLLVVSLALLIPAFSVGSGRACPLDAVYYPAEPIGAVRLAHIANNVTNTADGVSTPAAACCPSGEHIIEWDIGTSLESGEVVAVGARCSNGSLAGVSLPKIDAGYNGDGTECDVQAESFTHPSPGGNIIPYKANGRLVNFLGFGPESPDVEQLSTECKPNEELVGYKASSTCTGLTNFQVVCRLIGGDPDPSELTQRIASECPMVEQMLPQGSIGWTGTGWTTHFTTWAGERAFRCCKGDAVSEWRVREITPNGSFVGSVGIRCGGGDFLDPIHASTVAADGVICDTGLSEPFVAKTPENGVFTYKGGGVLNEWLGIGDETRDSNIALDSAVVCDKGLEAVGVVAAKTCMGLALFQVLCGRVLDPEESTDVGLTVPLIVLGVILVLALAAVFARPLHAAVRHRLRAPGNGAEQAGKESEEDSELLLGERPPPGVEMLTHPHPRVRAYRPAPPDASADRKPPPGRWLLRGNSNDPGLSINPIDMLSEPACMPDSSGLNHSSGSPLDRSSGTHGDSSSWTGTDISQIDSIELSALHFDLDGAGQRVKVGAGAFGQVYSGEWNGIPVAVKSLQRGTNDGELITEANLMRSLRHGNVVALYGVCIQADHVFLVMELLSQDLGRALHRSFDGAFLWRRRGRQVALQICDGLRFLHARGVIHFDLKSSNVLLGSDGAAKISDVGLSHVLGSNKTHISKGVGSRGFTPQYAAPEVVYRNAPCRTSADIYSFGVLLWEIVTGDIPRYGPLDVRIPEQCSQDVCDIIQDCIQSNPAARPSATALYRRLEAAQR